MIKFSAFMPVDFPEKTKVKFNMNHADREVSAWDLLLEDDERWIEMNAYKDNNVPNHNLNRAEYLLAFAQYYPYGPEYYIFDGMYRVEKILPEVNRGIGYKLTFCDDYKEYRKRLIIRLQKPIGRDLYNRLYQSVQKDLDPEVYEIAPATKLGAFPGYGKVLLNHERLQVIVKNEAPDWKNALSNVKGICCITDRSNGQLYIGSASGDSEGIWQRWSSYANVKNLTGGNKVFEELKEKGAGRIINNFFYSISLLSTKK